MRSSGGTLALCCCALGLLGAAPAAGLRAGALVGRSRLVRAAAPRAAPRLGSTERLQALAANATAAQRLLARLDSLPAKLVSTGLLLSVLGVGNSIVPEVYGWRTYAAGMSAFGGTGTVAARKAWSARQTAARSLLAELVLTSGAKNISAEQVALIEEELDVPAPLFLQHKSDVYEAFLSDLLSDPELQVGELAELQHLRRALRLPWPAVGARHAARGLALSRGRAGGRLRADDPESWRKVRKLLFLSDCLLAEAPPNVAAPEAPPPTPKKTPPAPLLRLLRAVEARADESTLIGRRARAALGALAPGAGTEAAAPTIGELFDALGVQADEGRAACREVALPVYARAVQSGIGRLSNSTAKQLERARKALQLDLSDTAGAHRDAFAAIAAKLAGTGRLDEDDREMLALIANALSLRERETTPLVDAATAPQYAAAVSAALERAIAEPGARALALWGPVALRQKELTLSGAAADAVLSAELSKRTAPLAEDLSAALDAGDAGAALGAARRLLGVARSAARFVSAMQSERVAGEEDIAGLCRSLLHGGAVQAGAEEAVAKLEAALGRGAAAAAGGAALSAAERAQLAELLGLPADAGEAERAQLGGRQLRAALEAACASGAEADFEAAFALEAALQLPAPVAAKARLDAFYDAIVGAAEAVALSAAELEALAVLVSRLDLSRAQLQRLNDETAAVDQLVKRVRDTFLPNGDRSNVQRVNQLRDILVGRF